MVEDGCRSVFEAGPKGAPGFARSRVPVGRVWGFESRLSEERYDDGGGKVDDAED